MKPTTPPDTLVSEKTAAELLDCSIHKLQRDRRIGSPIQFFKIGRSIKYRLKDIHAYIESQRFHSTSEYQGGGHE